MLPNFIIFGAIKSGTGALCQYLSHHPDVFVSPFKEPRYFTRGKIKPNTDSNKKRLFATSIEEYSTHFSGACGEKAVGEGSSNYIYSETAAKEIKQIIPNVKLIASLRNPVDRAWAHYQMMNKSKNKNLKYNQISNYKNEEWAKSSLYFESLKIYCELFNSSQIKVIIYEEWINNTHETLKGLYQFLEIDDEYEINPSIHYHAAKPLWPGVRPESSLRKLKNILPTTVLMNINKVKHFMNPKMPELQKREREILRSWYKDDVNNLQTLLQRDLSIWEI